MTRMNRVPIPVRRKVRYSQPLKRNGIAEREALASEPFNSRTGRSHSIGSLDAPTRVSFLMEKSPCMVAESNSVRREPEPISLARVSTSGREPTGWETGRRLPLQVSVAGSRTW